MVRLWDPDVREEQEPPSAAEAADEITTVAAGVCHFPGPLSSVEILITTRPTAGYLAAKTEK